MTLKSFHERLGITSTQWPYYRHWLIILVIAETLMLVFNQYLVESYLLIAAAFLIGFLLRLLRLYPGQKEPLILDFSAVIFALIYAYIAQFLGDSTWRFLLVLCSSVIIIPHFVFIAQSK